MGLGAEGSSARREETASRCIREGLDWILRKISSKRVVRQWNSLTGQWWSPHPCRDSNVDVALGDMGYWWPWLGWLDWMVSEGFSNLNDSLLL